MVICKFGVVRDRKKGGSALPTGRVLIWDKLDLNNGYEIAYEVGSRLPGEADRNIIITMLDDDIEVDGLIIPDIPKDLVDLYFLHGKSLEVYDEITGAFLTIESSITRRTECR